MGLKSKKAFDFVLIEGQKQEKESLDGDFFIMSGEDCIGELSVSSLYGKRSVSAETSDVNFTIEEWIVFMKLIQERFHLENEQEVMVNRYPASIEQYA